MDDLQKKDETRKWDWSVLYVPFGTAPIWGVFAWSGHSDIGLNTWMLTMMLAFLVQSKRELRPYRWFWITLVLLACAHIPLILWAPWNGRHVFGATLKGVMLVDFTLCYGVVYLSERIFLRRQESEAEEASHPRLPSLLD